MSASNTAKEAGLKSLADLVTLSQVPRRTLLDWYDHQPRKFDLALKGVLYEKLEYASAIRSTRRLT